MFQKLIGFWFSCVLLLSIACSGPVSDNCPEGLSDEVRMQAKCSILEVPQNRVRNTGVVLKLPVIRFNSPVPSSKPPLLYLEGGPGASALFKAEKQGPGLARLLERDIIYLEQRGTFNAWPSLVCKAPNTPEQCEKQWIQDKVDWPSYNTIESAEDVAELSNKLGTPLVLWGSSYGTLLAQRVVQRHPEVVDSLILEGSIPSDGTKEVWRSSDAEKRVLQRFSRWVKKKWAEARLFPQDIDPETDFPAALEAIAQFPFWQGVTGEQTLSRAHQFIEMGRSYPEMQLSLALWAYNVRHGLNKKESAEWLESFLYSTHNRISSIISEPMYVSTNCSDAYQFWSIYDTLETETKSGLPEKIVNSNMEQHARLLSMCKGLGPDPSGYPAAAFRIPARSSKRTLFLVGMLDTQTPAELAPISNFPNAKVVRGECIGHSFFLEPSFFEMMKIFLDEPRQSLPVYRVDDYCAKQIKQPILQKR